ncbi:DUF1835 domain-containing protein [Halobacillus fulvus]|nr:DUF1835 domain-containing protein [Halobacillus fulvus]
MIHVANGDLAGERLNVDGDVIIWREMYDMGPLKYEWDGEEMTGRRAGFFEERLEIPSRLFIDNCRNQEQALHAIPEDEEIVLWMEHTRYAQTMLMYLLFRLSKTNMKISMVTIDSHPEAVPFIGFGQLSSEQLSELLKKKKPVTSAQMEEAVKGWKAYTSSERRDIEEWLEKSDHSLPFLKQAMKRHLDYYPSAPNGLSVVETTLLEKIADGHHGFEDLFVTVTRERPGDGLSDLHTAAILRELTMGDRPLIRADLPLPNYEHPHSNPFLSLTKEGELVLDEKLDRIETSGIDWWIGGWHLYRSRYSLKEDSGVVK